MKRHHFITDKEHLANVRRRNTIHRRRIVTNMPIDELLAQRPDLRSEIAYLRRELAKHRGYCLSIPDRNCQGFRIVGEIPSPLAKKRAHESRPLCSACGRPRKR